MTPDQPGLCAGSGLNALTRDEERARGFLERHQDKLVYGRDCSNLAARVPVCEEAKTIKTVRRLVASKKVEQKLLYGNARRVFRI